MFSAGFSSPPSYFGGEYLVSGSKLPDNFKKPRAIRSNITLAKDSFIIGTFFFSSFSNHIEKNKQQMAPVSQAKV